MAKQRKTIEVAKVVEEANRLLKLDAVDNDEKMGICVLLEHILHSTGNYNGFNYNYWMSVGCQEWHDDGKPDFPEKNKYIFGPDKKKKGGGEYDRHYYYPKGHLLAPRHQEQT